MSPFQPSLDLFLMPFFSRIAKFETIKEEWGILEITHEFCIAIKIFKFQNLTVKFEKMSMDDEIIGIYHIETWKEF